MLSVTPISLNQAGTYYEKDSYYSSERPGEWTTEHARVEEISRALADITKKHSAEHVQLQDLIKRVAQSSATNKGARNLDEDVRKILILVTCLVEASPFASSRRRELGLG